LEREPSTLSTPAQVDGVVRSSRFLLLVVFLAGIGTLGIEMVASRLLAPYFGTAQTVWSAVIGLTLLYLAAGYYLGGALADRRPDERVLYQIIVWAGFLSGMIPLLAAPTLRFAQLVLAQGAGGSFIGALAGMIALFTAPVTLMAMVSPFAVRLQLRRAEAGIAIAGSVAGALSALSTVGSIMGTFLTALYLLPAIGAARTIYLIATFLIIVALIGLRDWRYLALPLAVAALAWYTLTR
jgi:MFS family permease